MGRAGKISRLSAGLRRRLQELIHDPDTTQAQVAELISAEAGEQISTSAVNRYAVRMREVADRNRQAREIAEQYLAQVGQTGQDQLGEVILHQVRAMAFDLLLRMQDLARMDPSDPEVAPKCATLISSLSRAAHDMEKAASTSEIRRRRIRDEALADAAAEAAAAVQGAGLSDQTVDMIRERILGVA